MHCISADVKMGKGIAVLFKKKFGKVDEIKKQGKQIHYGLYQLKVDVGMLNCCS